MDLAGPHAPVVLIVDDDQAIRETLRLALEDSHYTVEEAPDGVIALDMIRKARQGYVVLLDQLMPHLDGVGVLQQLARDEHLPAQHAYLLITASPQGLPSALQQVQAQLQVEVLPKPFDIDELLDSVAILAQHLRAS